MTKTTWPARLTPFTGGAALALLILGLVVHPIQAGTLECRQCMYKWRSNGPDAAAACAGKTGMALSYCLSGMVYEKCVRPYPPAVSPCGGTSGPPAYTDCASEACSDMYPCRTMVTTVCGGFCNGCSSSGGSCGQLLIDPPNDKEVLSYCKMYCGCQTTP